MTGMEKRAVTANVDIKIRMKEPLREQIERDAAERGISMNAAMVDRLNRSFMFDQLLGKWRAPELWFDTAAHAERHASLRADELGIEGDWSPDRKCFVEAMFAAIERLLDRLPGDLDDETGLMLMDMFKHALVLEHWSRKGAPPPGSGFTDRWPPAAKDDAA
jgi:hypothetical protein